MDNHKVNILVLEDDPADVFLFEKHLEEEQAFSFKLENATTLRDGIRHLDSNHVDVVMLDLCLPDSVGLKTFEKVNQKSPDIPIIILSGDSDESTAIKAVQRGAQDYLVKGQVDCNLLIRAIRYSIERNRLLGELSESARLDSLTKLPNRQLFHDRIQHCLALAKRYCHNVALLYIDLDRFKAINDTLGHAAGDLLLKSVAQRLKDCIRESDTVARLGGDEFAVILDHLTQVQDGARVVAKIRDALARPLLVDGSELSITASIGISQYPRDALEPDELIRKADSAMYRAKKDESNYYHFYTDSLDEEAVRQLRLEGNLRRALENDELVLFYQPQVDIGTHRIIGAEALLRWQNPDLGLLKPDSFIALAEETGLIVPIGDWVIRQACLQNNAWLNPGSPGLRVSVNLSARQFRVMKLEKIIQRVMEETELSPNQLVLELTESSAMQNIDYTITTLIKLRKMGVRIALDDFGTGYASLNYLKRLPLDMLKVDRSFVRGLRENHHDWAIISAIVETANHLQLGVLAEGVEEAEQISHLQTLKFDEMQGFYFGRPVAAALFTELLKPQWQTDVCKA